jgi:hypothetical protein
MKLATTILQLLASILLFSKTLTPISPYPQHSCLGRLLDSSWHLPIPVPLAKFPWVDMPTSLRSSTITAATTTNITLPDPNEVSYGIYLLVDLGNSSSFNANDTALLNTNSSWLPIPVPLAEFPWDAMPTSLRSSTITAATTTNITLPDPNEVSYGIYLLVDLGNSSSFNVNDTALLNTTVLPALSPVALPAVSFSFECKYILALLLFASVLILLILWQIVESSFQDDFGDDVLDSSENFDYAFLYGIDDDEENLDDDSLCYSVSTCASDDLNSVLSIDFCSGTVFSIESFTGTAFDFPVVKHSVTRYFLDDNDVSSDLFIASDCRVILPAVVECALPKMRQSPRIAAMPAVSYKKFY